MDSISPMGKSPNEVFEELKLAGIIQVDEQAQKVFVGDKEFSLMRLKNSAVNNSK